VRDARPGVSIMVLMSLYSSKAYWMADETCKECYDCKSVSLVAIIPISAMSLITMIRFSRRGGENIIAEFAVRFSALVAPPI